MNRYLIPVLFLIALTTKSATAQTSFPVKVDKKWGLINVDGDLIVQNNYQAIGKYNRFGYAVAQKAQRLGLLNEEGQEVLAPRFEEIKMLDEELIFIVQNGNKRIIHIDGNVILKLPFERVEILKNGMIKFRQNDLWGLCSRSGEIYSQPAFHNIKNSKLGFLTTEFDNKLGLINANGAEILPPSKDEIRVYEQDLLLFKSNKKWGALNSDGEEVVSASFDAYEKVNDNFLKFISQNKPFLFSKSAGRIVTNGEFEDYFQFSRTKVLCRRNRKVGLLDAGGNLVLSTNYEEILACGPNHFRVIQNGRWGIMNSKEVSTIPFEYNFITPPKEKIVQIRKGRLVGLANVNGDILLDPTFNKIELLERQVKAYLGGELSLYYVQNDGTVSKENSFKKHFTINIGGKASRVRRFQEFEDGNSFMLDDFEWFYSVEKNRWGLRRLDDGSIQIEPTFNNIDVRSEHGFTIVGLEQQGNYDFEWTKYRFGMIYGLVNNEKGLLISKVELWDIKFDDFDAGWPLARIVFSNGTHGLINKKGKIVKRDFAFIDEFHDGVARASAKGKLSGNFKKKEKGLGDLNEYLEKLHSPNFMVDYTLYDQEFESEAVLTCEDCEWGYLDTTGQVVVQTQYSYAEPFANEVAIVELDNKWGAIDVTGKRVLECDFDNLNFLENTDKAILQVGMKREKFGLIDTLGQVTVDLVYDELGAFSEERLAVKRNGLWGFVDQNGKEVIPCKYRRIHNFSEGLAAVQFKRKWGFIDKSGKNVIPFEYYQIGNFKEGLAWANNRSGVGYLNPKGEWQIESKFKKGFDFENNVARVIHNGKYGLIDKRGKYVLRPIYSSIEPYNEYGIAKVRFGNNRLYYGLINKKGALITNRNYQEIGEFSEGLAVIKFKDKYGYIDVRGRLAINNQYSKASRFSEGRAAIHNDGLCGFIDKDGEEVVSPTYSKCLDFEEGRAIVYQGYKQGGIIDTLGNYIIEPSVNRLLDFSSGRGLVRDQSYRFYFITESNDVHEGFYEKAGAFQHGVAVIQSKGRWGVINQKGIPLIAPKYDKIGSFENGYAKVRIKEFTGLYNLDGEVIISPNYEYISYAGNGLFRVEQGDKIGYLNAGGEWVWNLQE